MTHPLLPLRSTRTAWTTALCLAAAVVMAGCSSLPSPPARALVYDFGPGLSQVPSPPVRAGRAPLALADLDAPGLVEGSNDVLYRLAYADAQQVRSYTLARWSQPPAQLVQQALRDALAERRAVLPARDAVVQARRQGRLPLVLRAELDEFSQVFESEQRSVALVRMRATLVEPTSTGELLRGQRLFVVQRPAPTPDAAGGTRALAEATAQVVAQIATWVDETTPD